MRRSIKQGKRKGRATTASQLAILNAEPHLDEGELFIARAYAELDTCRQRTATLRGIRSHRIPWTAMVTWCAWHELDRDTSAHMMNTLATIDGIMLARELNQLKTRK